MTTTAKVQKVSIALLAAGALTIAACGAEQSDDVETTVAPTETIAPTFPYVPGKLVDRYPEPSISSTVDPKTSSTFPYVPGKLVDRYPEPSISSTVDPKTSSTFPYVPGKLVDRYPEPSISSTVDPKTSSTTG